MFRAQWIKKKHLLTFHLCLLTSPRRVLAFQDPALWLILYPDKKGHPTKDSVMRKTSPKPLRHGKR